SAARVLVVFFSSRRRHTRSKRDWSSDVCSSDLREQVNLSVSFLLNSHLYHLINLSLLFCLHQMHKYILSYKSTSIFEYVILIIIEYVILKSKKQLKNYYYILILL